MRKNKTETFFEKGMLKRTLQQWDGGKDKIFFFTGDEKKQKKKRKKKVFLLPGRCKLKDQMNVIMRYCAGTDDPADK